MQMLILSGSRNPEGRTARAVHAIEAGARGAGAGTECIFLPELTIERCRQCDSNGWGLCRREGRCTVEDDFPTLVEKIKASDVTVFATPVYFHDLSESMRAFLDRLRRICFLRAEAQGTPGISVAGLCYAGGSGTGAPSSCFALERILQTCGFDIVDMIPLRRQNLEARLPALESVGAWLATKPTSR
jgi:multimeric flavodoxin WrbA